MLEGHLDDDLAKAVYVPGFYIASDSALLFHKNRKCSSNCAKAIYFRFDYIEASRKRVRPESPPIRTFGLVSTPYLFGWISVMDRPNAWELRNQPKTRSEDFVLICATTVGFMEFLEI